MIASFTARVGRFLRGFALLRFAALFLVWALIATACAANDRAQQDFETWSTFAASENPWQERYVKEGWLGDKPPYLLPSVDFQMGPARISRREGTPGGEVVSGKYALRIETGKAPVNILTSCGGVIGSRKVRREVTAWLRGTGVVRFRIYAYNRDNRCIDTPFLKTITVTPEWKNWMAWYEPNRTDINNWFLVIEVGPDAVVDLDAVSAGTVTAAQATVTLPTGLPAPAPDAVKVAVAFPVTAAIRVDGRLDEDAWKTAEWQAGFLRHQDQANVTPVQAQFAFLYDQTHLYLGFAAAEAGVTPDEIKPTPAGQWPGGTPVEFFLDPGDTRDVFYQFAANVVGGLYESRGADASWNCDWQGAGTAEPGRWLLEARIPFAAFARPAPVPGEQWAMNICRNGSYMGPWAPVGPVYHNPAGFGLLLFGTYDSWWHEGFLPAARANLAEFSATAALMADPSLGRQVTAAMELLAAVQGKAPKTVAEKLDRAAFLELFQCARPVRTRLTNIRHEWQWVQTLGKQEAIR